MNSIDEVHPNLYFRISKEEALNTYHEIESKLTEPLTTLEFYERIYPFVDSFEDGHTDIQNQSLKKDSKDKKLNLHLIDVV